MVTKQDIEQRAANLSTEQRAAVNKQLSGMSTEELSNRTVQDIPEAPQPVQPVPEPVGDIAQPGDEAYDERKRQHQSDSGNYFISQTPGDESAPRAATAEELKTPIRSTNTGASQQGGRVSGESDSEYSDRIRDEIMNGEGSYLERTQKLEQFRAQQRAERLSRDTEPELFAEPTNVQEVKNDALANEASEKALAEQEKQQVTNDFNAKVASGASTQELAAFAAQNPQYADSFRDSIRSQFKDKANMNFFREYNGMSNESMYAAVKNGTIKVGSERYNSLPESQRLSFEAFKNAKDAPAGIPQKKDEIFDKTTPENTVDFSNIESFISKMFSSDLRTKLDEARNDDRVVDLTTELNAKASELEKFDLEGIRASKKLADDLGNQGFSPAMIAATVRDDEANRSIIRLGKVSEYNRLQGNLQSIKDDIDSDLELFKFEDQQAKEKYGLLFDIYNSRRVEQRADASAIADREFQAEQTREEREYEQKQAEFLEQNKQLAVERQNNFQREILEIEQQFKVDNKEPEYKISTNGKLYAVSGNKSVEIETGDAVFQEPYQGFTQSVYKNDDGTFTGVKTFDDGRSPSIDTYDAEGNIAGVNTSTTDFLHKWEGFRNEAYLDIAGIPTIGYGFTTIDGNPVQIGDSISQGEAEVEFQKQVKTYQNFKNFIDVDLSPAQETALTSFEYNLGRGIWTKSVGGAQGILKSLNSGDIESAQAEILAFNKARNPDTDILEFSQGLQNRRNEESILLGKGVEARGVGFDPVDVQVFNSLTASEQKKQQDNPDFREFVEKQAEVYNDPNADIFEVLEYSRGGRELNATQAEGLTKFTQTLNSLGEIQETISEGTGGFFGDKTGPITGIFRSKDPYDVTAQKLKAQITSLIPNLARGVYGEVGVLTEADVDLYRQTVPNLSATEDVNNAVLGMTLRLVRNGMKENLQDLARGGFDTSLYEGKIRRIDEQVDIIERNLKQSSLENNTVKQETGSLLTDFNASYEVNELDTILGR